MNILRSFLKSCIWLAVLIAPQASGQFWQNINGIAGPKVAYQAAHGRILVGTEASGIYYSDDGAKTWIPTQLNRTYSNAYALSGKGENVYAFVYYPGKILPLYGTNIYHSTDNGINWTRIAKGSVIAVAVSDSGQAFGLGTYHESSDPLYWDRYRIYRFDGSQWQPSGSSIGFFFNSYSYQVGISFFLVDHQNSFYVGCSQGLCVSTDEGYTWAQHLQYDYPNAMIVTKSNVLIAGSHTSADSLYGVFASTDMGQSWKSMGFGTSAYDSVRAVAADSAGNVFVATPEQAYRYLGYYDGWGNVGLPSGFMGYGSNIYSQFSNVPDRPNVESSPLITTSTGTILACGKTSGVYSSTDHGNTWVPSGPQTRDIFTLLVDNTGRIFAGTLGSRVYMSTDGGTSWLTTPADSIGDYVYSLAKDGSMLYAGTDSGVYRSMDGVHWKNITGGQVPGQVFSVCVNLSGSTLAGTDFGVYRSTDNGTSWRPSGLSESTVLYVASSPTGVTYAASQDDGVFSSADNGLTWNLRGAVRDDIGDLRVNSAGAIFLGVYGGVVRSIDNGNSWYEKDFAKSYVNAIAFLDSRTVFAGTYEGVYASYDGGDHWSLLSANGLGQTFVLSLAFDNAGDLIAGTHHGGMYRTVKSQTAVGTDRALPGGFRLFQNYPNPFNNSTVIRYSLSQTASVSLRVYDVLGRTVATLVEERQQPGLKSVTFDASGFSSGIYFCRIVVGTSTETRKMLFIQ